MRSVRVRLALIALCASLLPRPLSAQPPGTLVPTLHCVVFNPSTNTVLAFFGYASTFSTTVHVDVGPHNFFSPGVLFRNQPTEFLPGFHGSVFATSFTISSPQDRPANRDCPA
jgi:hypothetical protein